MQQVRSIHYLRGMAAILVVCFHARGYMNNVYEQHNLGDLLFSSGAAGVDLFFIISGFIISMSFESGRDGALSFIIKRFFRIYPVFIVMLLATIYINDIGFDGNTIKSLLIINNNFNDQAPTFGYNILSPAWSLSYEIYFYATFIISIMISKKYSSYVCILILLVPMCALQIYYTGTLSLNAEQRVLSETDGINSILKITSSPMLVEFAVGIILHKAFKKNLISRIPCSLCVSAFLFAIYCYISDSFYGYGPSRFGLWCLMLFIAAIAIESKGFLPYSYFLKKAGDYSYSIYLSHMVIIYYIQSGGDIGIYLNSHNGASKVFLVLSCTMIASHFAFKYIETPFINIGRRVVKRIYN